MWNPKPCSRCGRKKPPGTGKKNCGTCKPVDVVWAKLTPGPGDCWIWTGPVRQGYGKLSGQLVHRLVYEELICEIPAGLDLDHLCRVTRCANPWHLEPVTRVENNRRKWALYTHCANGHEYTPENTYVNPRGARECRICVRARAIAYQRRKAG